MGALNFDPDVALAEIRNRAGTPANLAKVGAAFSSFSNFSRASSPKDAFESQAREAAAAASNDDQFTERAAIIEYDAGVPREWAEGFARLDISKSLPGFTEERWQQLIDDGGRFLNCWATAAAELGWSAEDVFGVSPSQPDGNQHFGGLALLIQGGEVVGVRADRATIRMLGGGWLTYLHRASSERATPWELASREWTTFL